MYSIITEDDVRWFRNEIETEKFEEYHKLPAPDSLMPTVRPDRERMSKVELEGGLGRCNDGSNPVYYLSYGDEPTKWVIFFEGGDWCSRYDDIGDKDDRRNCVRRRNKGGLQGGTTRDDPGDLSLNSIGASYGQLDPDPDRNPLMHAWNKVYVRNCDGSSFTSGLEGIKRVDGTVLYFRGKAILDEVLRDLNDNKHLGYATEVVVAGCSAGGASVFIHADAVHEAIKQKARELGRSDAEAIKLVGFADSGFFHYYSGGPDDCDYIKRMQFVYQEMNSTAGLQPACLGAYEEPQRHKCLFGEIAIHFTRAPVFVVQSVQDGWQLAWVNCGVDSRNDEFGDSMWSAIEVATWRPKNGAFVDACQHHCHCYESIFIDGVSQAEAFRRFYLGEGRQRIWRKRTCDNELDSRECPLKRG